MKIFLSADIEGTAGITRWEEARAEHPSYAYFQKQMSKEVAAACRGATSAGADMIYVKDAHGSACNIIASELPMNTVLVRGWQMSPLLMMEGLDESFDGVIFTGYHSAASESGNPLSHTISSGQVDWIKINGKKCSEFMLNAYTAGYYKVPICFLSGDRELCESAAKFADGITTVYTIEGIGGSVQSLHPSKSVEFIEAGVESAVRALKTIKPIELPKEFSIEIRYKDHPRAYRASFYPGAELIEQKTVKFCADDYMDVLRFILFVIM